MAKKMTIATAVKILKDAIKKQKFVAYIPYENGNMEYLVTRHFIMRMPGDMGHYMAIRKMLMDFNLMDNGQARNGKGEEVPMPNFESLFKSITDSHGYPLRDTKMITDADHIDGNIRILANNHHENYIFVREDYYNMMDFFHPYGVVRGTGATDIVVFEGLAMLLPVRINEDLPYLKKLERATPPAYV